MRKWITLAYLAIVFVCGTYSAFWRLSANSLKQRVTALMNQPGWSVQHEGMVCSGFPFAIEIKIQNPLLTLPMSSPLEATLTQGEWTLGKSILKPEGWLEISGRTEVRDRSTALMMAGVLRCEFHQLDNIKIDRLIQKSGEEIQAAAQDVLQDASLHIENFVITSHRDQQMIFEVDRGTLDWKKLRSPSVDSLDHHFKLTLQGYEFHKQGLENMLALSSLTHEPVFVCVEDYGKRDFYLQGHVLCSKNNQEIFKMDSPFCIEVEQLTSASALGKTALEGKIELKNIQPDYQEFLISFSYKWGVTQEFHRFFVPYVQSLIQQYQKKGCFASYPEWENLFTHHFDHVSTLIPDYHALGPIETRLNLCVQLKHNTTDKNIQDVSINLDQYLLKTARYEIDVKGYKGFENAPTSSFCHIQISDHRQLLQDFAEYYNRFRDVLISTHTVPEAQMPSITHNVVAHVSCFLESLSQPDGDPSQKLDIIIQGKSVDDLTIGSYNSQQIDSMFKHMCLEIDREISVNRL